jgi:hypothetical protein
MQKCLECFEDVQISFVAPQASTPGCEGCLSLARGVRHQQVQHSEECRSRVRKRVEEDVEAEREREKMRKQAAEDEAEQRIRAEKRERAKDVEPAREAPLGRRTFKFIRGFKTKSWRRRSTRH